MGAGVCGIVEQLAELQLQAVRHRNARVLLFLGLTRALQVCLLVQDRLLGATSGRSHRWN
jgi:hypothetical protein